MADLAVFTDENFKEEVINSEVPVLVDFWAPWCAPCRALLPTVERLAVANAGSVKIGKLDISNEGKGIAGEYKVQAVPTLMVFKGGQPINKVMGIQPEARLQAMLDEAKD